MKEPDDGGNGDAVAAGATGANGGGDDDLSDDTRVEERVKLVGGVTTTNLFDRVDGAMPASAQALADESVLERRRRQQRVWVKRKRDAIRAENERKYSSLPTSGIASSDLHLAPADISAVDAARAARRARRIQEMMVQRNSKRRRGPPHFGRCERFPVSTHVLLRSDPELANRSRWQLPRYLVSNSSLKSPTSPVRMRGDFPGRRSNYHNSRGLSPPRPSPSPGGFTMRRYRLSNRRDGMSSAASASGSSRER